MHFKRVKEKENNLYENAPIYFLRACWGRIIFACTPINIYQVAELHPIVLLLTNYNDSEADKTYT